MERLGERIKKRRNFMQISLGELASQTGVSASLLSQIENGKAFPSIFTLKNIAEKLTTTVGELIGEKEVGTDKPLIRWDDKRLYKEGGQGCKIYALSDYTANRQMDSMVIELDKNSSSLKVLDTHHGQEIFHILKGEIELKTSDGNVVLNAGDTYYNHSCEDRKLSNKKKSQAIILWTMTPPLQ